MPTGHASLMPAIRRVVLAGTNADRTDGQLLGAFVADRDADAFALLVRRHGPMVFGVCRRVITDLHAAEDAFQAVFLVLARRAAAVKPREQVGNWLYGVAYRTALKARSVLARRRSREKQVETMPEPPMSPSLDDWADLQPVIDEELNKLPEKLRAPVILCDLEGRPQREVAKHLNVPPATLATRLASARRTLAQRLTKRGVTLSGGAVAALLTSHAASAAVPTTLIHGLARAAEALAAGGACSGLVSASAVQLSEGVIRMMLLSKLKAVAVVALTAAALTTGLGLGLVPARADGPGEDPTSAPATAKAAPQAKPAPATTPPAETFEFDVVIDEQKFNLNAPVDDATFLRRLSLDIRGVVPTDIETIFFVTDEDDNKRAKVVAWLIDDDDVVAAAAKQLGLPADRVRVVKQTEAKDGKPGTIVIVIDVTDEKGKPAAMAFSPDGKKLAIELQAMKEKMSALKLTADGKQLQPHGVAPRGVAFSPDGKQIELKTDVKDVIRNRTVRVDEKGNRVVIDEDVLVPAPGQGAFRFWADPVQSGAARQGVWVFGAGDDAKKPGWAVGQDGGVRVWDFSDGKQIQLWSAGQGQPQGNWYRVAGQGGKPESDLEFLKRVTMAARGTGPTGLEEKYFTDDKDPKKREKLIDSLLKEPAVAKKLGDDFKKRMLSGGAGTASFTTKEKLDFHWTPVDPKTGRLEFKPGAFEFKVMPFPAEGFKFAFPGQPEKPQPKQPAKPAKPADPANPEGGLRLTLPVDPGKPQPKQSGTLELVLPGQGGKVELKTPTPLTPPKVAVPAKPPVPPVPPTPALPQGDKLAKLVDALLAAKKTDAEMLEAITLAVASRLPTDVEKRLTLGLVSKSSDRKAAWLEVAKAMAGETAAEKRVELRGRIVPENPPK